MNRLLLIVMSAGISWLSLSSARSQSVRPIYSFDASGANGAYPEAPLAVGPDGNFYGTTEAGGSASDGTVFCVTPGGALTNLVQFNGTNGSNPLAGLTLGTDGNFYGTTEYGGSTFGNTNVNNKLGGGTVFRISTNGAFLTLVSFNGANGSSPHAGLTLGPDGNFYGTTGAGGAGGYGTVFKMTTGGQLTTLTNFNSVNGASPFGGLTFGPDGYLYGATQSGGSNSGGTLFKMTTNGTLTTLFIFGANGANSTNGINPQSTMVLGPDGNLYGTTDSSGLMSFTPFPGFTLLIPSGNGTVYRLTTNGTLTTVADLDDYDAGGNPIGTLALGPDGSFYGTTYNGSDNGMGALYRVTTNGIVTTLNSLDGTNGAYPTAGLTLGLDGNFYGAASSGGPGNNGTIFTVGLPPGFITSATDQSVIIGDPATFSCQVFGTTPLAYQWLSNSVPVTGATGNSLKLANVFLQASNAQFQLVATNAYGSVTSPPASLSLVLQPNSYAVSNSGGGNYTVLVGSYPSSANRLWATTNLASPKADWQMLGTIETDTNGMGQFFDSNTSGSSEKFYQLSYP